VHCDYPDTSKPIASGDLRLRPTAAITRIKI
jgi:hypothetical protein